mgnify:CR=1 FL=1
MALQNSQYDALMRYYQRLQFRNKHEQDARIAEAQARIPRLALIDQEIAAISVKKARILLGDKNATDFDLNEQIQALSRERTDLLKANGYPEDYLKMHYTCPLHRNVPPFCWKTATRQIFSIRSTTVLTVRTPAMWRTGSVSASGVRSVNICIPSPISGNY